MAILNLVFKALNQLKKILALMDEVIVVSSEICHLVSHMIQLLLIAEDHLRVSCLKTGVAHLRYLHPRWNYLAACFDFTL